MTEPDSTMPVIASFPGSYRDQSKTVKRMIEINEFYDKEYESILDVIKRKKKENKRSNREKSSLAEILDNISRQQSLDQVSVFKFMAIYPTMIRANQENVPLKYKNDSLYKIMRRHLQSKNSLRAEQSVQSPNNQQQSTEENPLPTLKNKNSNRFASSALPLSKNPNSELPLNKITAKDILKTTTSLEQQKAVLISDFWVLEDGCILKSSCSECPEGALDGQLFMDNLAELKKQLCK